MPGRFAEVVRYLPQRLREMLMRLPEDVRGRTEEIRLRAGMPLCVNANGREFSPESGVLVHSRDIAQVLDSISQGSFHTVMDHMRQGFVTVSGGHRVGLCGTAALREGGLGFVREPSSVCFRIAREKKGVAVKVLPGLLRSGLLMDTLILSPPGTGKTTLLRDLARLISDGSPALEAKRVAIADERGEIAACHEGVPQLDVGQHTDVWTGLGKAEAALMLLRGFSPQVLVMDELTAPEDVRAVGLCAGCGVTVLSTAHAENLEDLWRRPVYRPLMDIFTRIVVIGGAGQARSYHIQEVQDRCQAS